MVIVLKRFSQEIKCLQSLVQLNYMECNQASFGQGYRVLHLKAQNNSYYNHSLGGKMAIKLLLEPLTLAKMKVKSIRLMVPLLADKLN